MRKNEPLKFARSELWLHTCGSVGSSARPFVVSSKHGLDSRQNLNLFQTSFLQIFGNCNSPARMIALLDNQPADKVKFISFQILSD